MEQDRPEDVREDLLKGSSTEEGEPRAEGAAVAVLANVWEETTQRAKHIVGSRDQCIGVSIL